MPKKLERKSRMTPEALKELDRRAKAGESLSGLFDLATGRPIKQTARLAAINAEVSALDWQ
jgi:hypothetical protein